MTQYSNKAAMANTFIDCVYNPTTLEITNSRFHNFSKIPTLSASPFSTEYCKLMLGKILQADGGRLLTEKRFRLQNDLFGD